MKKAIVVYGGWEGHQPKEVAAILENQLKEEQFEVVMSDTLDIFRDEELMKSVDLVVMQWTMGTIEKDQLEPLSARQPGR
jgi:type 1 glutamine amidotransferase